jgi:hypothetical protein
MKFSSLQIAIIFLISFTQIVEASLLRDIFKFVVNFVDSVLFPGDDAEKRQEVPPSTFEDDCPRPSDALCTKIYLPVLCDDLCSYSNECIAASAGYDVDQSCVPVDGPK